MKSFRGNGGGGALVFIDRYQHTCIHSNHLNSIDTFIRFSNNQIDMAAYPFQIGIILTYFFLLWHSFKINPVFSTFCIQRFVFNSIWWHSMSTPLDLKFQSNLFTGIDFGFAFSVHPWFQFKLIARKCERKTALGCVDAKIRNRIEYSQPHMEKQTHARTHARSKIIFELD